MIYTNLYDVISDEGFVAMSMTIISKGEKKKSWALRSTARTNGPG